MALNLVKPEDEEDGIGNEDRGTERGTDESREQIQRSDDQDEGSGEDQEVVRDEEIDGDEDSVEPPQRRPLAAQEFERENRELRERLARLEGQLSSPDFSRREAPQVKEPSAEEKALWTTEQYIKYELSKSEQRNAGILQNIQFQTLEAGDKAGWASYCAQDPRARRMTQDVETRLQELRKQGQWGWSRGDVYTRLVGERVISQGTKAATVQREQGAKKIQRQQTKGNSPAGDQRRQERPQLSDKDARNKRLREGGFFS